MHPDSLSRYLFQTADRELLVCNEALSLSLSRSTSSSSSVRRSTACFRAIRARPSSSRPSGPWPASCCRSERPGRAAGARAGARSTGQQASSRSWPLYWPSKCWSSSWSGPWSWALESAPPSPGSIRSAPGCWRSDPETHDAAGVSRTPLSWRIPARHAQISSSQNYNSVINYSHVVTTP